MRRSLEFVALAALTVLWGISIYALLGPSRLPERIPTHFNLAGNPDAWGGRQVLWLLPAIGTLIFATMTTVALFPGAFNYPVPVTPANRAALQNLALRLIAWLKAEVVCLFAWIQQGTIAAAKGARGGLSPFFILTAVVVVFVTVGWHLIQMRETAGASAR